MQTMTLIPLDRKQLILEDAKERILKNHTLEQIAKTHIDKDGCLSGCAGQHARYLPILVLLISVRRESRVSILIISPR